MNFTHVFGSLLLLAKLIDGILHEISWDDHVKISETSHLPSRPGQITKMPGLYNPLHQPDQDRPPISHVPTLILPKPQHLNHFIYSLHPTFRQHPGQPETRPRTHEHQGTARTAP